MADIINNPTIIAKLGFKKIILFVILALAVHILLYRFIVNNNEFVKNLAWNQMVKDRGGIAGDDSTGINYEIKGKIIAINNIDLTLESNNKQIIFSIPIAFFVETEAFAKFEEWPTKIISVGKRLNFKTGDEVTIVARTAQRTKDNSAIAGFIIKQIP